MWYWKIPVEVFLQSELPAGRSGDSGGNVKQTKAVSLRRSQDSAETLERCWGFNKTDISPLPSTWHRGIV